MGDYGPRITGSLKDWREQNPDATVANIEGRRDLTDADFVHLKGINTLNMSYCRQDGITDAAFVHLKGIHTLNMSFCSQAGITDAAFVNLKGIHTLNINYCSQDGITDAAFVHLKGIHTLNMHGCNQPSISNAAFLNLKGIYSLNMTFCDQITDAAFVHLRGIQTLVMSYCDQITDAAFVHLKGIHTLNMSHCNQPEITDAAFVNLKGIYSLDMGLCSQAGITNAAFVHLKGIHTLSMHNCNQDGITDAAFVHLKGIHTLDMSYCSQRSITDAAFVNLKGVHTLDMHYCYQSGITDAAFVHLKGIHTLNMRFCRQAAITDAAFVHLKGIHTLKMDYCKQPGITGERLYQLGDKLETLIIEGCNPETIQNANQVYGVTERDTKVKFYHPPQPQELWKGLTRSDIKFYNDIFIDENKAKSISLCPVCLEYVDRIDACNYMYHNCNINKRHPTLYEKYKNSDGIIYWCTICSRIASGHRHYKLINSDGDKPGLEITKDVFTKDCRPDGGGGFPEKIARFRRFREYALELQEYVDIKPRKEALIELIEEVWNAPLRREGKLIKSIINKGEWNISNNNFPENKELEKQINAPNIPFNGELPVMKNSGDNHISMNYGVPILEFKHKQKDNSEKIHGIQIQTLELFLQEQLENSLSPKFGYCFMYPDDCDAKLHPEEIKSHVPEETYIEYKRRFNNKFTITGGGENDESENILQEATDAVCALPPETGGRRKMTRRRRYLKTRKNKGKRKHRKTRK